MKSKITFGLMAVFLAACSHKPERQPDSTSPQWPSTEFTEMVAPPRLELRLRAGYSLETRELKGCVLYLQGLADSIRNHQPYFSKLNAAGYRVIFFDYMGQGGSEGSMNQTRVQSKSAHLAIPEQGEFFRQRYQSVKNVLGQDCGSSPKIVVGWSTGGLSAYRMAAEKTADAVILIAPGIHPKTMVGEAAHRWDKMLMFRQTITERTLTRNRFENGPNPHVDPIKPKSPARVPQFAMNLVKVASQSTRWEIDPSVSGIVFLSGEEDTYVDRGPTLETLKRNAPHFRVISYEGALHELDNELPEVANDLAENSIRFLDSVVSSAAN